MKRVIIVLVVMMGIIVTCILSLHKVGEVRNHVDSYTNAVFTSIEEGDTDATRKGIQELVRYWCREEAVLVRYVRHAQVDEITKSMSKLERYAKYEAYHELEAELSAIVWQMEHVWESEKPKLGNLL